MPAIVEAKRDIRRNKRNLQNHSIHYGSRTNGRNAIQIPLDDKIIKNVKRLEIDINRESTDAQRTIPSSLFHSYHGEFTE